MPICVRICSELDSIYAYRAAVTINFMLMIIAYAVLMRIIMAFQKEKKVSYAALISGIAILYPSWLYYSRSTMTEILVMGMYIVICMLMSQYLEKGKKKVLIALILSLVYISLMALTVIGYKCNIPLETVKKDTGITYNNIWYRIVSDSNTVKDIYNRQYIYRQCTADDHV